MYFELPHEILEVPSHLSWIPEFIPHLETEASKDENFVAFIASKFLLWSKEEDQEDLTSHFDAVFNSNFRSNFHALARFFNRATFYICLTDFNLANKLLSYCSKKIQDWPQGQLEKQEGYQEAFEYLNNVAKWQMSCLKTTKPGRLTLEEETDSFKFQKKTLTDTWNRLYEKDKKFTAAIKFFKGYLAFQLGTKWELQISKQFYIEAAKLDTDCYVWCHIVYTTLRRIRKVPVFGNKSDEPSEDETYYCQRAYDLCPGEPLIILDYAILFKESFWEKDDQFLTNSADKVKKCIELLEECIELATSMRRDTIIPEAKLQLALILIRSGNDAEFEKGKALLESLPEDVNASYFLARFYMHGRRVNGGPTRHQDLEKAIILFIKVLGKKPDYHYCVKDFLKAMKWWKGPGYEEFVLQFSNKFIERNEIEMLRADVLSFRGGIFWPDKPTLACQSWIDALIKFPTFKEKVYQSIKDVIVKQPEYRRRITRKEIITQLTSSFEEYCNPGERRQIIDFIGELNEMSLPASPHPPAAGVYVPPRGRAPSHYRNQTGNQNRRVSQSEADNNDNWRK